MKILNLKAENFKRLRAVDITPKDITPKDNTVILAGANEQGKSSVLDAIWAALSGGDAARTMPEPIRKGEERATVSVDLGDIKITRIWTPGGGRVAVTNAEGLQYPSPQAVLDKLVGKLTFDPLAFARMEPREQRATLLKLVELPFDLDAHEIARQQLASKVSQATSNVKYKETELNRLGPAAAGTRDTEISVITLMNELKTAQSLKSSNDRIRERVGTCRRLQDFANSEVSQKEQDIAELEDELRAARQQLVDLQAKAETATDEFNKAIDAANVLVDPDTAAIEKQIADSEKINQQVRLNSARRNAEQALETENATRESAISSLASHEEKKMKALAAAKFPVNGLAFDDAGVRYKDIPFAQCSESQRILVSAAMGMAMNPKLKVMFIRDGSSLDSTRMAMISDLAREHDYQIWIERVDETGDVGFIIEDGTAREAGLTGETLEDAETARAAAEQGA